MTRYPTSLPVAAEIDGCQYGEGMVHRVEVKEQWRSFDKGSWPDDRPLDRATVAYDHNGSLGYIVVYEMTHDFERHNGERFAHFSGRHVPDWLARRDQLNGSPLAEEAW